MMADGKKKRRGGFGTIRLRPAPKGRDVEPQALADVRALLGDRQRSPDLLIEHLHLLQDRYGHLSVPYLTALAFEMRLTPAEVYEVATFYHHFDVVKDGEAPPPPLTVRVCDSIACHLAGAGALRQALARTNGAIRILAAPCVGRCEHAPVVVVGRNPVDQATPERVTEVIEAGRTEPKPAPYIDYAAYRASGGYEMLRACVEGGRTVDDVIATVDASGLRGLGGAGFPAGR
ncbi:MAG: NAD(P)H-dependent oxidoreductase subunit E, partial [Longimicrobiales bacterium]